MRNIKIGDSVVWIDSVKREHPALITNVFGTPSRGTKIVDGTSVEITLYPAVNLVLVSSDETKGDGYGRQIERQTSVLHIGVNPAAAFGWKFADE